MDLSELLNAVTNGFLWQCGLLCLLRSTWRHIKTECQTAKTAVGTGVDRVVESLYQCIPSTSMLQVGWEHHPHSSHTTDETAVDVLIYTIACCLGMCHAAAQSIQHCSMASVWPQAGEHQSVFCVPKEKPFLCSGLLFAQEKYTECLQVCDAELSCCVVGTTPCKIPGGRRQAGDRGGGLKQMPNSVFNHSQKMCSS